MTKFGISFWNDSKRCGLGARDNSVLPHGAGGDCNRMILSKSTHKGRARLRVDSRFQSANAYVCPPLMWIGGKHVPFPFIGSSEQNLSLLFKRKKESRRMGGRRLENCSAHHSYGGGLPWLVYSTSSLTTSE